MIRFLQRYETQRAKCRYSDRIATASSTYGGRHSDRLPKAYPCFGWNRAREPQRGLSARAPNSAHARRLGFSYLITSGNEAVTDIVDYLEMLIDDRIRVRSPLLWRLCAGRLPSLPRRSEPDKRASPSSP